MHFEEGNSYASNVKSWKNKQKKKASEARGADHNLSWI